MKKCGACKEFKEFNDFYKDKKSKDGMYYECKLCAKTRSKKYKEENGQSSPDFRKIYNRVYYLKNKELLKSKASAYKKENLKERSLI